MSNLLKKNKTQNIKSSKLGNELSKMNKESTKLIRKSHEEQGMILALALIVGLVMVIITVPFLFKLSAQYRISEKSYKSLAALNLAEAGVERAIWELNYGDITSWDGDDSLRTITLSSFQDSAGTAIGDVEIKVTDPDGDNPVIDAIGKVPYINSLTVIKTLRIVLEKSGGPSLFDYGIFGNDGVHLDSNALIDSYDSRDGLYGGDNVGSEGHVGTNATSYGCISLDSNAKIYGNALSGPETEPDDVITMDTNSHIYGDKLALSELKELPSIAPPEGLPGMGDYYLGHNKQDTISESGEYSSFRLDSNSKVTITADVTLYITGQFHMDSNTELEILDGVSLTIYLGGSFEQDSNTTINNLSKDPTKLLVFGTDSLNGEMEWDSNSDFWGAVYAPRADVHYDSNADLYGSIVSNYIEIDSNAKIHYDEALGNLNVLPASESSYVVKSWQEKQSP